MLPFLFKWAYGGLSDLVPIRGQRRRPYVVAGALLGALNCLVLGLVTSPPHPTLPKLDTSFTAHVRSFSTHGHQSAAKGSSTTVSRTDIRLILTF
jgi:hypothetical protein